MHKPKPSGWFVGLCWLLLATPLTAAPPADQDVPGASDHPSLGRIPGAVITAYEHKTFAATAYPVDLVGYDFESRDAAGEYWRIVYKLPRDVDPTGAIAIYARNIEQLGLEVVWRCRNLPLSRLVKLWTVLGEEWTQGNPPRKVQCLVAGGRVDGRPTIAQVYTYNRVYPARPKAYWGPTARLYIVQDKPLDTTLEVVTAEAMATELSDKGHVALYGILFDHDSARIKPESSETMAEIARYLKAHPKVKLYVAGHTDNTGSYDYNLRLSQRRAEAVAAMLRSEHGIAAARLKPVGVGPVAPVASNAMEAGRAKNRRVELVAQ